MLTLWLTTWDLIYLFGLGPFFVAYLCFSSALLILSSSIATLSSIFECSLKSFSPSWP